MFTARKLHSMSKQHQTNQRKEGNKYDKIIKENLKSLIPALLNKVLGLKVLRIEDLPAVKMQTTLEREPDFLQLVYDEVFPEGRIIHLEFESSNETNMERRMLAYLGMLYRKHGLLLCLLLEKFIIKNKNWIFI